MTLTRASARVVTALLCLIVLATITAPPVNAYYGYPAPRHSDDVAREATSLIAALNVLKAWLRGWGEPITQLRSNSSLIEWGNAMLRRVTSPSEYALLVGGIQLKALKVLAGLNPVIRAQDVVGVLNASINYMVMQGIVNSTKVMWNALTNRASCQVALNYVALSIANAPKGNSSIALRALSAIAAFQEALAIHRYGDAHAIMRETAENTSLIVAAYMACQLPPQIINEVVQPPSTGEHQGSGWTAINAKDVLKAVAVLERLGPRAIEILSKVPVTAVIDAVSKVPLNVLRNMSVDEIVKAIEVAATNNNVTLNPSASLVLPGVTHTTPPGIGTGQSTGNVISGVTEGERPPIPRHWIRPQPSNLFRVPGRSGSPTMIHRTPSASYVTVPAIGVLVEVVKSVNIPTLPASSASTRWWSLTLAEAGGVKTVAGAGKGTGIVETLPMPLLTLLLGLAVFVALTLTLRIKRGPAPVKPLPRVETSELPAVVREFWEAVTVASRVSGAELRANLTHREIVSEILRNLRTDAGRALLKLATLYEGVRYAGVKVTKELSSIAQELLQEVKTLLEAR